MCRPGRGGGKLSRSASRINGECRRRRQMAVAEPRSFAGHDISCPYQGDAESGRNGRGRMSSYSVVKEQSTRGQRERRIHIRGVVNHDFRLPLQASTGKKCGATGRKARKGAAERNRALYRVTIEVCARPACAMRAGRNRVAPTALGIRRLRFKALTRWATVCRASGAHSIGAPTQFLGRAEPPAPKALRYEATSWPYSSSPVLPATFRTARNASWGMSTRPTRFMRFLPSFCFSRSLRLREMSPP